MLCCCCKTNYELSLLIVVYSKDGLQWQEFQVKKWTDQEIFKNLTNLNKTKHRLLVLWMYAYENCESMFLNSVRKISVMSFGGAGLVAV